MNRKYTIDVVKDIIHKMSYTMIDETFSTIAKGFTAITSDGYKVIMFRDNVIGGRIPHIFHKSNPYTIENIRLYLLHNNIELKLISNSYNGNSTNLEWQCKCGQIFQTSWSSVLSGRRLCNNCSSMKASKSRRLSKEKIINEINRRGYSLLQDLNDDICISSAKIHLQDNDNYRYVTYWNDFSQNKNPERFHPSNKYTMYNINNFLLTERNNEYCCIDDKYVGNNIKMKFVHNCCGTVFDATLIEMQGKWIGKRKYKYYKQCPKCNVAKTESTHAAVLKQVFLHEYPDTVVEDRSCINPLTKYTLPTDIVNHRLKIAIEIQSSYHDTEKQQKIDLFKKNYWLQQGYKFYDPDIRDYTILELIQLFFKNITQVPDYVDYNWCNTIDFTLVQQYLDNGYTINDISGLLDVPRGTISGLVRDKKIILPKGYVEKVKKMKPIIRLTKDGKFITRYNSLKDIKSDHFAAGTVERVLFKKQSFSYDSFWLYEEDYLSGNYNIPQEPVDKFLTPVVKYDINGNFICRYNTIYDAEMDSVSSKSEIYRVAQGKRKSSRNEKWKFIITS